MKMPTRPPPQPATPPVPIPPDPDPLAKLEDCCAETPDGGAVTASIWLAEPDPPEEPIVHGLIDAGDRVALVGQSKARKSFYALQLAVAIATGAPFLGYETERRRVLLFNGEIRAAPYKKRLRRMLDRLGIAPDALADLSVVNASEDVTPATFESILKTARRSKAGLVVADPAYLLIEGDESDQVAVKTAVRQMKLYASEGVTLVCVYHGTKGKLGDRQVVDRVAGSGVFARDASTMISLCEHATEADHAVMTAITRNHPPAGPATVRFDDGAFVVADGVAAIEKTSATKPRRVIGDAELLTCFDATGRKYSDAVNTLRERLGIGRDRAKEELTRAVKGGLVKQTQQGKSTLYSSRTDTD